MVVSSVDKNYMEMLKRAGIPAALGTGAPLVAGNTTKATLPGKATTTPTTVTTSKPNTQPATTTAATSSTPQTTTATNTPSALTSYYDGVLGSPISRKNVVGPGAGDLNAINERAVSSYTTNYLNSGDPLASNEAFQQTVLANAAFYTQASTRNNEINAYKASGGVRDVSLRANEYTNQYNQLFKIKGDVISATGNLQDMQGRIARGETALQAGYDTAATRLNQANAAEAAYLKNMNIQWISRPGGGVMQDPNAQIMDFFSGQGRNAEGKPYVGSSVIAPGKNGVSRTEQLASLAGVGSLNYAKSLTDAIYLTIKGGATSNTTGSNGVQPPVAVPNTTGVPAGQPAQGRVFGQRTLQSDPTSALRQMAQNNLTNQTMAGA